MSDIVGAPEDGLLNPRLVYGFSTYVKNAFCIVLRHAFAHHSIPPEYRYYEPNDPSTFTLTPTIVSPREAKRKSQISIDRDWPGESVMYPRIIISTEMGDASIQTLGDELGYPVYETDQITEMGRFFTGTMYVPTKLTVYAQTPQDRERITDLLMILVRYVLKDKFIKEQMPYLAIQAGENGEEDVPGIGKVFLGEVRMTCQTNFDQYVDMSLMQLISDVNISGVHFGTDAANFQSDNTSVPGS